MKGQMVFEFLIAGIMFFAIVVYSINYLNVNVSDFKWKFYQDKLQGKAMQISDILMNEKSSLGLVGQPHVFSTAKIQNFSQNYCDVSKYHDLLGEFYLVEKTVWGTLDHDMNILLFSGESYLDCGAKIPGNTTKAEVERVGLLNNDLVKLRVVVW